MSTTVNGVATQSEFADEVWNYEVDKEESPTKYRRLENGSREVSESPFPYLPWDLIYLIFLEFIGDDSHESELLQKRRSRSVRGLPLVCKRFYLWYTERLNQIADNITDLSCYFDSDTLVSINTAHHLFSRGILVSHAASIINAIHSRDPSFVESMDPDSNEIPLDYDRSVSGHDELARIVDGIVTPLVRDITKRYPSLLYFVFVIHWWIKADMESILVAE